MGKFFNVTVKPDMSRDAGTTACNIPFGAKDILFDWTPFQIPKGSACLNGVECLIRGTEGVKQAGLDDIELLFAKTVNGAAPSNLGVINAIISKNGWFNHIINSLLIDVSAYGTDYVYMSTASAKAHNDDSAVLTGEPNTGDNVGYDTLYVAGIATTAGYDFGTGVIVDGSLTASGGVKVINADGVAGDVCFDIKDVLVHADGTAIGTIKTVTDDGSHTTITLEDNIPANLGDGVEICNKNPLTFILSFEK